MPKRTRGRAPTAHPHIHCPCCKQVIFQADAWYDCACFQGGKAGCINCSRPAETRDAHIAAVMRYLGWDRRPSPGMLDYLTPGWRVLAEDVAAEAPPPVSWAEDVDPEECPF